jgi:nitrite reductase/ring-hydroxylating ferredoxin subunit
MDTKVSWLKVCAVDDVAPGEAIAVASEPAIAVFNVDGTWYATDEECSHDKSSLVEGYIEGDQVECAWHFAKFCLRTGEVLSLPATEPIRVYPTKVDDGAVYVEIPK